MKFVKEGKEMKKEKQKSCLREREWGKGCGF
jgi:hypothetical protein